jgi:hypothetical protein
LPLRELKGETVKETRSAVEDRRFAKTKDEEEREEEATSADANDTTMAGHDYYTRGRVEGEFELTTSVLMVQATMAAIFVCEGLCLFIVNPQSDRVGRRGVNLVPVFWFLAKIYNRVARFIVLGNRNRNRDPGKTEIPITSQFRLHPVW